jgi:hypothetical protein
MVPNVRIWDCGLFEKVPCLWTGMVDGSERCPEYDIVCG